MKYIDNPILTSKNSDIDHVTFSCCLGNYLKPLLYKHVNKFKSKPFDILKPGKNCLSKSRTFLESMMSRNTDILKTLRIKEEGFNNMPADIVSFTAKNDPLLYL